MLSGKYYNNKVDLWSICVILYSLFFNPYKGNTQVEVFGEIQKNKIKKSKNQEVNDLVSKLLIVDPDSRINWNEYFNHKFWKLNDEEDENIFMREKKSKITKKQLMKQAKKNQKEINRICQISPIKNISFIMELMKGKKIKIK